MLRARGDPVARTEQIQQTRPSGRPSEHQRLGRIGLAWAPHRDVRQGRSRGDQQHSQPGPAQHARTARPEHDQHPEEATPMATQRGASSAFAGSGTARAVINSGATKEDRVGIRQRQAAWGGRRRPPASAPTGAPPPQVQGPAHLQQLAKPPRRSTPQQHQGRDTSPRSGRPAAGRSGSTTPWAPSAGENIATTTSMASIPPVRHARPSPMPAASPPVFRGAAARRRSVAVPPPDITPAVRWGGGPTAP